MLRSSTSVILLYLVTPNIGVVTCLTNITCLKNLGHGSKYIANDQRVLRGCGRLLHIDILSSRQRNSPLVFWGSVSDIVAGSFL